MYKRQTFVCENPGVVDDPLGFAFVDDKKRLGLDLCEVRMIIEPEIAALAAELSLIHISRICGQWQGKRENSPYGWQSMT